jgi:hypothetical protein
MKLKMALMGRKSEENPIYKKLQVPLAGFKIQDLQMLRKIVLL